MGAEHAMPAVGLCVEQHPDLGEVHADCSSRPLCPVRPFAEQLGLEMLPSGCVRIDELVRTSRQGVCAAGDLAHMAALPMPLASVLTAASAGLLAATAADRDLLAGSLEVASLHG